VVGLGKTDLKENREEFGVMWLQQAESINKEELPGVVDMAVLILDLDITWWISVSIYVGERVLGEGAMLVRDISDASVWETTTTLWRGVLWLPR